MSRGQDSDDFEKELAAYSELETIPKEQADAAVPRTILQYQQRIEANNRASIFDADYYTLEDEDESGTILINTTSGSTKEKTSGSCKKVDEDIRNVLDGGEDVRYFVSGRGRGGRNIILKPGQTTINHSEDDEITRLIRRAYPLGMSNALIENEVKRVQQARAMEQAAKANGSPSTSTASFRTPSKTIPEINGSPVRTNPNSNIGSPVSSGKSSSPPCTTASDAQSSDYFTPQEQNVSFSPSRTNQNADEDVESSTSEQHVAPNTGAIPKRPAPLSVILKQSREEHFKKKQLERHQGSNNNELSKLGEADLATREKIEEILHRDFLEEQEMRKRQKQQQKQKRNNATSSTSASSQNGVLPWRQRNNSPPRYAWGQKKESGKLNISSLDDFPALK